MTNSQFTRQWDLDWLRVLVFGVLILYHVGMYYVADWGWHIKSAYTSELLQNFMLLSNQWRMSLLFFISGIVLAFCHQRMSTWQLIKAKTLRLFVPLLFGMYVVVAPQMYIEMLDKGLITMSFFDFWLAYINPNTPLLAQYQSEIGLLTWNHLWFLAYLWVYCLLLLVFTRIVPLRPLLSALEAKLSASVALGVAIVTLFVVWMMLRQTYPSTHGLIDDWYNHGKYFSVFLMGYIFALLPHLKASVVKNRHGLTAVALIGYTLILLDKHGFLYFLSQHFETNIWVKSLYGVVVCTNHWAWMLALIGYSASHLTSPNPPLRYATSAVLPWYILHQTLIIGCAYWLKPFEISPGIESIFIIALTALGCFLGYEVIQRNKVLCVLFGVAKQDKTCIPKAKYQTVS
ncbi:acyltransferase family protein [Pseudoalteromonas luteoviolacea]|uniref:acyltransferase family protein n=1 Tax=Pseudoalteromonas luteoviolacea TaxID=43657 RepID=UPI001B38EE19|nr:acyltransferase family protein [Pseudoalteromonas luteoviolacea]MBQ4812411.1 acyltransferase family protein [Pseudoalteromonas luteoviolacea]